MQLENDEPSSQNLKHSQNLQIGLKAVGKISVDAMQWIGKFAHKQHDHAHPSSEKQSSLSKQINQGLKKYKISTKSCGLCMVQKNREQFLHLCKCSHDYCYSCLNSYAISKIEDLSVVVCPHQECGEVMPLSSKVYKYLPDTIKIKFLQNKNIFKVNKLSEENRCQRCFEPKHEGGCKYSLQPKLIDHSFKYRECPTCKNQVYMTQGKKRVVCEHCKHSMCYLCGNTWKQGDKFKHVCGMKGKILQLQRQYQGRNKCCDCEECCASCRCDCDCCDCCDSMDCDNDCQCDCCRKCDNYDCLCELLFYCDTLSFGCVIWNIISIPVRLILIIIIGAITTLLITMMSLMTILSYFLSAILMALFVAPCKFASEAEFYLAVIILILYPFTVLFSFFYLLKEMSPMITGMAAMFDQFFDLFPEIWIGCSPKQCLDN